MLPTKFRVNWPFCSREEAKIDFQDGHNHLGFPIRKILAIFDLQVTRCFLYFKSIGLMVQEEMRKIELPFSSGSHLAHLSGRV